MLTEKVATPETVWSPLDFDREAVRVVVDRPNSATSASRRFARNGVRQIMGAIGGTGTVDTVRLDGDVLFTVVNFVLPELVRWRYDVGEALIVLRASLCCDVAFSFDGRRPLVFNRPGVTLACLPAGMPQTVDIRGGVRQQSLVAVFRAATFAARYGLEATDLPAVLRNAIAGKGAAGRIASLPLDHRIATLVADTIDTRLEGELKVVHYAGRVAELVAYTLDAIGSTPELRRGAFQLRRDVDLAQAALSRLEQDYRKPPHFVKLARDLGTNQNKLKSLFKDAFGVTMTEYCLERRMREAQQLLLEAALTIAQVAERVGYEHQSSFAAAFHRHLGMSPSEYRQHRAPFEVHLGPPDSSAANGADRRNVMNGAFV